MRVPAELKPNSVASGKKPDKELLKRRTKRKCALFLFLRWWPQLYARGKGRKWRKWVVVLSHSHQQLSGAPQAGEKGISNVLWEVNKALGVSRILRAVLVTSQGISLSFQFRPYMQTSDIQQTKYGTYQCHDCASRGGEAGQDFAKQLPWVMFVLWANFSCTQLHWCKTYLLHTSAKLIACPYQLHSLQFCFSWPQTHLLSEGSWCTSGMFFSSVSVLWKEGSLLIFLPKISNDTCFSTVRE